MGRFTIGSKARLKAPQEPQFVPNVPVLMTNPQPSVEPYNQFKEVIKEVIREVEVVKHVDRPFETIREIVRYVEVPKEVIVEKIVEVQVIKEVPVEVVKEVEKIVRIPVLEVRKVTPRWVGWLFWFEVCKYTALLIWLAVK